MRAQELNLSRQTFRHVYLVQGRRDWVAVTDFDPAHDLVLTYDFGLHRQIAEAGGSCAFLDHLVGNPAAEQCNFAVYDFFEHWSLDASGQDILRYHGLDLGMSLRIHLWNDLVCLARLLLNLKALREIESQAVLIAVRDPLIPELLGHLGVEHLSLPSAPPMDDNQEFYFPIGAWLTSKLKPRGVRHLVRQAAYRAQDLGVRAMSRLGLLPRPDGDIFCSVYHPTAKLAERIKADGRFGLVCPTFSKRGNIFRERHIAMAEADDASRARAEELVRELRSRMSRRLVVDGFDATEIAAERIFERVSPILADHIATVDRIERSFSRERLKLMVTIGNISPFENLLLAFCRREGIPSMIIINGLLLQGFGKEAKDADWINSYGPSIRDNYFRGMDNVVCLGDPRMDAYSPPAPLRLPARGTRLRVVVGTAGFDCTDVSSYVACEFVFMHDVLLAFSRLREEGITLDVILKVRPNGYAEQYRRFLEEYFPDLKASILDAVPFRDAVSGADFYVSIYSQTLFEASALGIPVVYYKNDTQILFPPFDGESELATARTPEELAQFVERLWQEPEAFTRFSRRDVMERYVGPLDGDSAARNLEFIYSLAGFSQPRP